MQRLLRILAILLVPAWGAAQEPTFAVPDRVKVDGVPPIPLSIADAVAPYGQFRQARLLGWHPTERRILISTVFSNVSQVHEVRSPGGARTQLTFFRDGVTGGALVRSRRPLRAAEEGYVRRRRSDAALPVRPRLGPRHDADRGQGAPRRAGVVASERHDRVLVDEAQRPGPRSVRDESARSLHGTDHRGSRGHMGCARLVARRQGSARAAAHSRLDRDPPVADRRRVERAHARDAGDRAALALERGAVQRGRSRGLRPERPRGRLPARLEGRPRVANLDAVHGDRPRCRSVFRFARRRTPRRRRGSRLHERAAARRRIDAANAAPRCRCRPA